MRITNIDTLSALLDRLITENIKLFFFEKENKEDLVTHQKTVIEEIKYRINSLFNEVYQTGKYEYLSERRTFNTNGLTQDIEALVRNDIHIGESDRARLQEAKKDNPDWEIFKAQEQRLRIANEGRANGKNKIDSSFYNHFEKDKE